MRTILFGVAALAWGCTVEGDGKLGSNSASPAMQTPGPQSVLARLDSLAARADALEVGEYACRPAAQRLLAAEDDLALARTRVERRRAAQEWMMARHGLRRAVRR
jgi:hypothetical protein